MIAAGVTTVGRGDMILAGKDVKKARYAHQVGIAVLHILLKRAHFLDNRHHYNLKIGIKTNVSNQYSFNTGTLQWNWKH